MVRVMAKPKTKNGSSPKRVAVVAGLRTPFARQGTAYKNVSALDLGRMVVQELLARAELDPKEVDSVVFGQVVPSLAAPNIAREIVLGTSMLPTTEAYSVSRACATSLQAIANDQGYPSPTGPLARLLVEGEPMSMSLPSALGRAPLVDIGDAEITNKRIRRGVFRSVKELEAAIREYIEVHNENPKPFVWTRTADQILESIARFAQRTSSSAPNGLKSRTIGTGD